jgi:hypothetical protein
MLVYEQNRDILALGREAVKGGFNMRVLGLAVDDEKVLLRVRGLRDMLPVMLELTISICDLK